MPWSPAGPQILWPLGILIFSTRFARGRQRPDWRAVMGHLRRRQENGWLLPSWCPVGLTLMPLAWPVSGGEDRACRFYSLGLNFGVFCLFFVLVLVEFCFLVRALWRDDYLPYNLPT